MPKILEVTNKDIEHLTDLQLTRLLSDLLYLECEKNKIPKSSVNVSLNITVGDGGADARVHWEGDPDRTNWITKSPSIFQCKASPMGPTACGNEVLTRDKRSLKGIVKKNLDENGAYILFYYKSCNPDQIDDRIQHIKSAFKEANHPKAEEAEIEIYDANKIAKWANEYISIIHLIYQLLGRQYPEALYTWEQLSKFQGYDSPYFTNDDIVSKITQIQKSIEPRSTCRILGLSGIGKTRLVFEAFNPSGKYSDVNVMPLSSLMVYIDAAEIQNLQSLVIGWREKGLSGIIVADNCDEELHQKLYKEVTHSDSKLSLISIDYSIDNDSVERNVIELSPTSDDIIEKIIENTYKNISKEDITRIAQFAEGFPIIAVLLANARLNEENDIGTLKDPVLINKLLWGRKTEDKSEKKVIRVCSLFDFFGIEGDLSGQRDFLAQRICKIDSDDFYSICIQFQKKGVIDIRHRYARVVPRPLALKLAADWWEECTVVRALKLFTEEIPEIMIEPFCRQTSNLQFSPKAKDIVKKVCGEQSPFGNAEVINSERGSRLFRAFSEVNPIETTNMLYHLTKNMSFEELKKIDLGRRNLVWALEKLCFWQDTYPNSWRILSKFAVAENESWANNSTEIFLELFRTFLSGTEVPPINRIEFLNWMFLQNNDVMTHLAIKAIGQIFKYQNITRMVGVEYQGTRPTLKEWRPKSNEQIREYWKDAINILKPYCKMTNDIGELARLQISENIDGIIRYGLFDFIKVIITEIIDTIKQPWIEINNRLLRMITVFYEEIPEKIRENIELFIKSIEPKDLSTRAKWIVSIPDWLHKRDESGNLKDISAENAQRCAKELSQDQQKLFSVLPIILFGEQRQGIVFGRGLAINMGWNLEFIKECVKILLTDLKNRNTSVLIGYISNVQGDHRDEIFSYVNEISSEKKCGVIALDIIQSMELTPKSLEVLLTLVDNGSINIRQIYTLAYGSVMSVLNTEGVIRFLKSLMKYGKDGNLVAFKIGFMYWFGNKDTFPKLKEIFIDIFMSINIEWAAEKYDIIEIYNVQEVVKKLLLDGDSEDFAEYIISQIIEDCKKDKLIVDRGIIRPILGILFDKYLSVTWHHIGNALITKDWRLIFNISHLIGEDTVFDKTGKDLISRIPNDLLLEWLKENAPDAPIIISENLNILSSKEPDGSLTISDKTMLILDNFGDCEEVLNAFLGNLLSFGSFGSRVPYYKAREKAFTPLLIHRNKNVQSWAEKVIDIMKRNIELEKREDEERDFTRS